MPKNDRLLATVSPVALPVRPPVANRFAKPSHPDAAAAYRAFGVARVVASIISATFLCLGAAIAATKYVAKTGSDSNDGNSMATAYLTIGKGIQNIGSAGRLYIGGGTYAEAIIKTIPSGTSTTARTTITNYQSEVVTIRPNAGPSRVLEFEDTDKYITFAGNAPYQIILDGTNVANNVVKFSSTDKNNPSLWPSYIRLQNLEIKYGPDSAVLGYPDHCEFLTLKIHDAGSTDLDHGMYIQTSDNVIDGCTIYNNYSRGIQIYMSGASQSTTFASRNTIRNCRIYGNGTPGGKPGIDSDSGTGNKIYNNLIYNNAVYGIKIQSGGTNTEIYNNTFYGNGTRAVFIQSGSSAAGPGTIIRNNIAYANGIGGQFEDQLGTATLSNNVDGTNPQFASTDPANSEFLKLTASSTIAIDQGTNVAPINTLITRDYWGDPRPQGAAYDIGADEYIGAGPPPAPGSLTAVKAPSPDNYRQINLSWTNVANETGYKIERKTRVDGTYAQIATVGADVVTYNDNTCGCGTTYYYRVRAYNASGNSAYSPEANAITDEVATRTAHWKFNEGTGTTTSDSSGNANNGTLANGPAWVTGKIGNGLSFDGVDDVVQCGSGTSIDNMPAVSACAWINATSMGEGGLARIVQKSGWSPQQGWFFFLTGTNQLGLSADFATTKLARNSTTNVFTFGTWYHVTLTWDGSATATNVHIYVNGTEVGSYATTTNGAGARVDDSASSLFLGNDSTGVRTFNGSMDDVRLYSRVLTTNEILAIYRAGL